MGLTRSATDGVSAEIDVSGTSLPRLAAKLEDFDLLAAGADGSTGTLPSRAESVSGPKAKMLPSRLVAGQRERRVGRLRQRHAQRRRIDVGQIGGVVGLAQPELLAQQARRHARPDG